MCSGVKRRLPRNRSIRDPGSDRAEHNVPRVDPIRGDDQRRRTFLAGEVREREGLEDDISSGRDSVHLYVVSGDIGVAVPEGEGVLRRREPSLGLGPFRFLTDGHGEERPRLRR